jgi:hypothetical protein
VDDEYPEERERAAASTRVRQPLTPDDQAWLVARLEEYGELLDYLHEH